MRKTVDKATMASWEETVFEHRNKEYGAYRLRYTYPYHLSVSALIVILIFLAGMFGMLWSKTGKKRVQASRRVIVISYNQLSAPPPIQKIYVPPKPPKRIVVKKVKVRKYMAPIVTKKVVNKPKEMMTMAEVKKDPKSTDNTVKSSEGKETDTPTQPAKAVVADDIRPPEFPGGRAALMKWLAGHLRYPAAARRMGVEGKVVVVFLVDENGKASDPRIKLSLQRLCDNEAIRLVKSMPDWIPGERNGLKAREKITLQIPFVLK